MRGFRLLATQRPRVGPPMCVVGYDVRDYNKNVFFTQLIGQD
jgi:hypothetical protein